MAGIIQFNSDTSWMVASWAYESILSKARTHLPIASEQLDSKIGAVIGERLHFFNLQSLTEEEVKILFVALGKAYEEAKDKGIERFIKPEFYPGFLERFGELIATFKNTYSFL